MAIVTVEKNRYTVDTLYQWDKDQVLQIYGTSLATIPEIHFTNLYMDKAIVRQATMDDAGVITVDIPNSLLQKPYKITAYVCIYEGETFKTLYAVEIPIKARTKPADYTLEVTDDEVYSFNALETKLVNVLARYDEINTKYDQVTELLEEGIESANEAVNSAKNAQKSATSAEQSAKIAKEYAQTAVGQSDWGENDETLASYVRNRTHWKEPGSPRETLAETNLKFTTSILGVNFGGSTIVEGKTYIVTWKGTEYTCTAFKPTTSVILGNHALVEGGTDTGEPFGIEVLSEDSSFITKNSSTAETISLKIESAPTEDVYHKLPKEYLPDNVGGVEPIIFTTMDFMTVTCNKTYEECLTAFNNFNTNVVLSIGGAGFVICSVQTLNNHSDSEYENILYPCYQFSFDGGIIIVDYYPNAITITTPI